VLGATATDVTASPVGSGRRQFYPLPIARVDRLCDDAAAVTFDIPPHLHDVFRFRAGQSLTVRRRVDGRDERRNYSICAAEGELPRIGVREVVRGAVSSWLVREVRPGDRVEVQPPSGSFTPDVAMGGRHVLIAAGSGITPILSIASTLLRYPNSDVVLLYGNRRTGSVMFADELADLKDAHPTQLQLVHVLSREPQEVELFHGRLDAARLRALIAMSCGDLATIDHWWLCGPFGMVTDAVAVLRNSGVPAARIHRELFYVEAAPPAPVVHPEAVPDAAAAEVTVVLDGRATTTAIGPETPILDGAQRVRPDLPFACKGGVCGTCRAKIVSGEARMRRNFALEDDEVEDGYVLTCQAVPVSSAVTVDYDA
jgi:ring-1,2-phenylacetyl-CoA epoxidase subunit PaaE